MHPRKNSVSGRLVDASAEATLCGGVCTAASRSREGFGLCGGELLRGLQRSQNSANDIALHVATRVGPTGTFELIALKALCRSTRVCIC